MTQPPVPFPGDDLATRSVDGGWVIRRDVPVYDDPETTEPLPGHPVDDNDDISPCSTLHTTGYCCTRDPHPDDPWHIAAYGPYNPVAIWQTTERNTPMEPSKRALKYARRGLAWIIRNGHEYDLDISRVDLTTLDLEDDSRCLLFQAAGSTRSFVSIADELDDDDVTGDYDIDEWLHRHGFDIDEVSPRDMTFPDLNAAWHQILTQVRTSPTKPVPAPASETTQPQAESDNDAADRMVQAITDVLLDNQDVPGVDGFIHAAEQLSETTRQQLGAWVVRLNPANPVALNNAIEASLRTHQSLPNVAALLRAGEQINHTQRHVLARQIMDQVNGNKPQGRESSDDKVQRLVQAITDTLLQHQDTAGVRAFTQAAGQLNRADQVRMAQDVVARNPVGPAQLLQAITDALRTNPHIPGVPAMLRAGEQITSWSREALAQEIAAQYDRA